MRKFSQVEKQCPTCKKLFMVHNYRKDTAKYCSGSCKRLSPLSKWLVSIHNGAKKGSASSMWKGEDASYYAKHMWINDVKGRIKKCEFCGITEKSRYHWANVSGEYTRDLDDYIRLCVPCHKRFDQSPERMGKCPVR